MEEKSFVEEEKTGIPAAEKQNPGEKPARKQRKWGRRIIALVVILLLAADIIGGNYLVNFALARSSASGVAVAPESVTSEETSTTVDASVAEIWEKTQVWLEDTEKETVEIISDDGLRLKADIFPSPEEIPGRRKNPMGQPSCFWIS